MLQTLEGGSGEQLLLLLDADSRQQPAAQALSRRYDQVVRGARPVRLSQVEFKSEARGATLLVTGTMRLHAGEPTIGMTGEKLLLHAEFAQKGGKVQLTGLAARWSKSRHENVRSESLDLGPCSDPGGAGTCSPAQ
jgi:hypothetical protein